ncbi:MAG: 23S rRNA (adenine(2503)-C(2))-methyltransferase RlmN [Oscillospiraceae bacterium]
MPETEPQSAEKTDILSLTFEELSQQLAELGAQKFRAAQVFEWLHVRKVQNFTQMTNLSIQMRTMLDEMFCIKSLFVAKKLESYTDNTVKYLYRLSDGNFVETVLMDYAHGTSVCVSTQVGCRMGCRFCASAIAGFRRNLTASEILLQIYESERESGRKISSVVLMGIGEPLDNYDNVVRFLRLLSEPKGFGLSLRHVSLSTCGLVPEIDLLADEGFGLTLSVSLHAADDTARSGIMPVNLRYPVPELMAACDRYFEKTGRRISFEFAVIEGINDTEDSAIKLARLIGKRNCHVNLIPVNAVKERDYHGSRTSAKRFLQHLKNLGINATIRRTLGADIEAACGQLRRSHEEAQS